MSKTTRLCLILGLSIVILSAALYLAALSPNSVSASVTDKTSKVNLDDVSGRDDMDASAFVTLIPDPQSIVQGRGARAYTGSKRISQASLPSPRNPNATEWYIECVDCPKYFDDIRIPMAALQDLSDNQLVAITVDQIIAIAEARALASGETATVKGNISAPIGLFRYDELWMQDDTAGIDVYGVSPSGLQLGDIIKVTGAIDEYYGKKEIIPDDVSDIVLVDRGVPPAPLVTDTVSIDENSEGWLVVLNGTVSNAGGNSFSLDDGSGATRIYLDSDTGIDTSWIQDGDILTVIGISSQYDSSAPHDSGYQVVPRYQYDFAKGNVMPIALARQRSEGDIVTVQGAVTALPGTFEDITLNRELYIQDGTAGIDVYNHGGLPIPAGTLSMGDIVTITGELFSYNGRMEIIATEAVVQGFNTPIEPKIQLAGNISELTEGLLVVVTGTVSSKSSSGFDLTDHSGTTAVYIDGDIDINMTGINDGDTLRTVGLSAQYDADAPYDSGYQIMIRTQDDLEIVSPPVCEYHLAGVSLSGSLSANINEPLTFIANVQPSSATLPISYTWSSDGLVSGQGTAQATYQWSSTGNKMIQVSARNCGGQDFTDSQTISVNESPEYAIIHYHRPAGDYDGWGLHLWGEAIDEPGITWQEPKPFAGIDDYGAYVAIKLKDATKLVNYVVHKGNDKDTLDDRSFDPMVMPELWIVQGDANNYGSRAEAQGYVTIHYTRTHSDFDGWGLHLWQDSELTDWNSPHLPDGYDDFGAYYIISDTLYPNIDFAKPLNFIMHNGNTKDTPDDRVFSPMLHADIWLVEGDASIYTHRGAIEDYAIIHYRRLAGDYGDYTSEDFNDFWGVHAWDAAVPHDWTMPYKAGGQNDYGVWFKIPLLSTLRQPQTRTMGYILHRGNEKDPPEKDQILDLEATGYEIWVGQGLSSDNVQQQYKHPAIPLAKMTVSTGTVYLPFVVNNWPPFPGIPQLQPISNPNGLGDYTVTWNATNLATSYILQESHNSAFTLDLIEYDPTTTTSQNIEGKGAAIHYYRVRSVNEWGESDWSNIQQTHVLWESEDNDSFSKSDGPLVSGIEYQGYPEDTYDLFKIISTGSGQMTVRLKRASTGWLRVYHEEQEGSRPEIAAKQIDQGNASIQVSIVGSNFYYIEIYTANTSQTPYTLQVTYP